MSDTKRATRSLSFAAGLLALGLAASAATPADAAKGDRVRWGVPIAFSSNLIALGDTLPWVAGQLEKMSDGNIKFEIFEPGKMIPAIEVFDATSAGKVDAGYSWMGYEQGKVPASALFGAVPFGMNPWEFSAWMYYGGGDELLKEVFAPHNVVPIYCGVVSPETAGWFRKEINSLDDLKGLKIRFAGIGGKVLQKVGASVTVLPGGEIFQALEKGVIDGTEFSIPTADEQYGFYKVAKYNYFPGWHQPFTAQYLYVNKGAWDKLSPESQAMINTACIAGVNMSLSKSEAKQAAAVKFFKEQGVTTTTLSPKILEGLQKATDEVLDEEAAKDAMFKKVIDAQRSFAKSYATWADLGYLPRGEHTE
ncbi:MAG: TRAP transporter substrate-binding protein [Rhodospirillales bacterium]|nr:TRAP transporter substrate-binding protein [Rhodospirillales bacterium]